MEISGGQFPSLSLLALDFARIPLSSAGLLRPLNAFFRFCVYSKKFQVGYGEISVCASLQLLRAIKLPRLLRQRENFGKKRPFFL
jgi:hypothetical protein